MYLQVEKKRRKEEKGDIKTVNANVDRIKNLIFKSSLLQQR